MLTSQFDQKGVLNVSSRGFANLLSMSDKTDKAAPMSALQIFPPSVEFRNVQKGQTYTATLKVKVCFLNTLVLISLFVSFSLSFL